MKKVFQPAILQIIALFMIAVIAISFKTSHTGNRPFDNWRELGRVKAGHNGDHDRIEINGPHDSYRRLKFRVEGSPLNMRKMVVVYEDGAPENIETKDDIPKDGESRSIDLKGGKRKLKSVEFWFETKGFLNGKAEVILYGSK